MQGIQMTTYSYTRRTLDKFLREKHDREKPWCGFIDGEFCRGFQSTHLSRPGIRFNRLLRLRRKLQKYNREDQ